MRLLLAHQAGLVAVDRRLPAEALFDWDLVCAALAWEALVRGQPQRAVSSLHEFWRSMSANDPWDQIANQSLMNVMSLRDRMVLPEISISSYQAPFGSMPSPNASTADTGVNCRSRTSTVNSLPRRRMTR